jgi:DNA repair protein RadC
VTHRVREVALVDRPRERLNALGAPALSATELLTILWGAGSADAASDALDRQ